MNGQTEIIWGEEVIPSSTSVESAPYELQETEIGLLNSTWDVKPFEWFLQDNGLSYGVVQPGDDKAEGVPIIRAQNISGGKVLLNGIKLIDAKIESQYARTRLKGDELLITVVGSLGDCVVTDESLKGFNVARAVAVARFKDAKDRAWLKYCFQYGPIKAEIGNVANTTVQPTLNLKELRQIPFPVPSPLEKNTIVAVLSSLDDKIDLLHQQNTTLEALAETLFRQWFVEEAKEEWEDCALEDICTTVASGGTPSTRIDSYYNGEVNWYSTKELRDNYLFQSENRITELGLKNSSAKMFPANTVVIAIYAAPTVGRLGILANQACFNQAACGFVANPKFCSFEFLFLFLKYQRAELNAMASGSAQQNLNVGKIRAYPAFKVPSEYMDSFLCIVRPLFSKIKENSIQIRTLSTLRDTLLPKLMSGEVRVAY